MNVVLMGPPGAGKGTQSFILQNDHNFIKISTGDLVREEISKDTVFGRSIRKIVDSGSYLTDDIIIDLIKLKVIDSSNQFIFDGVPRTLNQVLGLENILQNLEKKVDYVIEIDVDENLLAERITTRYVCKNCEHIYNKFVKPIVEGICDFCQSTQFIHRADDTYDVIKKRLDIYRDKTKPLIDFYREKGIFHKVNGMTEVKDVREQIRKILNLSPAIFGYC